MVQWARPKWINGHHESVNAKSKLFWLVWLVVVVGAILWLSHLAANGTPVCKSEFVSQGDGSRLLISKWSVKAVRTTMPRPYFIIIPPATNTYYFTATATDRNGLESDYSNEVSCRLTNQYQSAVTLAWDASSGTNVITNYAIYIGGLSRTYTNRVNAGTNLTKTVYVGNPRLTNVVITVTSQNATNLQWCSRIGQPWTLLGATNWTATNPTPRFWRAMGRSTTPGKAFISSRWQ